MGRFAIWILALLGASAPPPSPGPPVAATVAPGSAAAPGATAQGAPATPAAAAWRVLEPGLDFGEFRSTRARGGDGMVRVVRVDPARFRLLLLNASSAGEGRPHSAREWADRHSLVASINASMYQTDLRSSVSLMRTPGHVNNPRLTHDQAVLAFDRTDPHVPLVQIIDRECQDFEALSRAYGTLVQSIRMVSCSGRNVWSDQPRPWSIAAIGVDRSGRVLLIHARSPHSPHDLIDVLLAMPLDLKNAMYAEGGHEAQMFVRAGGEEHEYLGLLDAGDGESSDASGWPIPNVIGVARVEGAAPPAALRPPQRRGAGASDR